MWRVIVLLAILIFKHLPLEVSLKEFDHLSAQLHAWCIEKGAGMAALPKVREFIAVTDKETGTWMRARVTRQLSDRFAVPFFSAVCILHRSLLARA